MDLVNLISKSAPLLGSMLGSPISGVGISWIASLFGADPKNVNDIMEKIRSDPESDVKLRQLEMEHKEELLKIQSDDYQTEVDDRKDARAMHIAIRDFVPEILAIGFLSIYAFVQIYAIIHPASINDLVTARIQDVLLIVFGFYFGGMNKRGKPDG